MKTRDATTAPGHEITPQLIDAQNALVDHLLTLSGLPNDRQLSKKMRVPPPALSKLRHGRAIVTDGMLVRIHDAFDLPIREIRAILGVPSPEFP